MSHTVDLLDDETRPRAAPIEGVTERQRMQGRRLAMIHGPHRDQMAQVRSHFGYQQEQLEEATAATVSRSELAAAVNRVDALRQGC